MSINDWSAKKMLQIQFAKELRKGYLNNAKLNVSCRDISDFLIEEEICIVCIMANDETEYYFTDRRVVAMSDVPLTVIWYRDIVDCDLWFFDDSRNIYEWKDAEEKKIYISRLLVTDSGHNQILFTGLGDSINTVRYFFQWLANKNLQKKTSQAWCATSFCCLPKR
ncbi:MAG: hypothetical protein DRR16_17840 [Candidatus Parabeggiatoa sp. nov. 3]|jgi:hypothetical protein|nr:MAG: hypothetical protein DRR00_22785 [Gammaproteobacteria bacterium]RKZ61967.1 MAG: hypothetical protein DRQ99_19530 [Gammaproteobacteria bacterium]RKZ83220.1 MAG: hypothetical protein DRR16_17840 [Gammaproteobacteria bacterium]